MLLTDVKAYLIRHKRATTAELTTHFGVESGALTGMLEHWIRKGMIRPVPAKAGRTCGGCTGCAPAADPVYEWTGPGAERKGCHEGALVTDGWRC
jgi:hypothetical protein